MHITQWGEYGVHCAVFIAQMHKRGQDTVRAAEIAESQHIPLDYTQQILQRLRKAHLVASVRGPTGGYKLEKSPDDITLYDVILAAEGDTFEVICENKPLSMDRCDPGSLCNLRPVWLGLKQAVNAYLSQVNLRALMETQGAEADMPVQINSAKIKAATEAVVPEKQN
jgi:Rrf2 family iron-sulfur cluster assembly transcriptional regulator